MTTNTFQKIVEYPKNIWSGLVIPVLVKFLIEEVSYFGVGFLFELFRFFGWFFIWLWILSYLVCLELKKEKSKSEFFLKWLFSLLNIYGILISIVLFFPVLFFLCQYGDGVFQFMFSVERYSSFESFYKSYSGALFRVLAQNPFAHFCIIFSWCFAGPTLLRESGDNNIIRE